MSLIDFIENYFFRTQNEVQSKHWYNFQLTILVHITYTVNLDNNSVDQNSRRLCTEYHYYCSDDRKHDNLFVPKCFAVHWKYLKDHGIFPTTHFVWSDGCAAQFKEARAWFHVACYPNLTICDELPVGCTMEWNFWSSSHGKGPHDGAGAYLKRSLRKEQLKLDGMQLLNGQDIVQFLKSSI